MEVAQKLFEPAKFNNGPTRVRVTALPICRHHVTESYTFRFGFEGATVTDTVLFGLERYPWAFHGPSATQIPGILSGHNCVWPSTRRLWGVRGPG